MGQCLFNAIRSTAKCVLLTKLYFYAEGYLRFLYYSLITTSCRGLTLFIIYVTDAVHMIMNDGQLTRCADVTVSSQILPRCVDCGESYETCLEHVKVTFQPSKRVSFIFIFFCLVYPTGSSVKLYLHYRFPVSSCYTGSQFYC